MGQIRHGCAPTTQAIKATIQRSQAMNAAPSREDGIKVKTVAKWRERETLDNRKTGLTEPGLTVLNPAEAYLSHNAAFHSKNRSHHQIKGTKS